jgi:surface polysaccharide O-acyltransferase-like enzyme
MGRKVRIEEIQLLRGIAFLAVVLQHTIGHYDYQPDVQVADGVAMTFLLLGAKFAVPLFLFITGLVLFYNYEGELHYLDFVRKRVKDIIVPYLIWSLVYVLYFHELGGGVWASVRQLVHVAFTGKASYHLWYVVMVFQFYLLFPLFRTGLRAVARRVKTYRMGLICLALVGAMYLFLTSCVSTFAQWMGPLHIPVFTSLFTTYADRNFVYFFYYFVLGAVAGLYIDRWRNFVRNYQVVTVGAFLIVFAYFVYKITSRFQLAPTFKINFNDTFLIQPKMALLLILFLPVLYLASMNASAHLQGRAKKAIEALGNYSYGAYLIHVLMLDIGIRLADWLLPWANATVRTLVTFALCASLATLLTMLLSRLPWSKWTVGIAKKKSTRH